MKTCIKCFTIKPIDIFPKKENTCCQCVATYMSEYRKNNKERIAQLKKDWKIAHSEHVKSRDKAYGLANPERRARARLKWILANPEENKQCKLKYAENNKDLIKISRRNSVIKNRDKIQARCARRRSAKLDRTPKWETTKDKESMAHIYWLANEFSKAFGIKYEVDHIIPLQGILVSGLHTPLNLQILPATDNRKKSNKYDH